MGCCTAPIIITCKEKAGGIAYCIHRYSQLNMLNHLKQFIDTGKEQQFRRANDVGCVLYSSQGFSYPTLYFSLEQISTLKTCQELEATVCLFFLSSVQSLSPVWVFATPWTTAHHASLSFTNSRSLLKLMSITSVWLHAHLKVDFSNLTSSTYSKCEGLSNNDYI